MYFWREKKKEKAIANYGVSKKRESLLVNNKPIRAAPGGVTIN
jgi:hypothetical protein